MALGKFLQRILLKELAPAAQEETSPAKNYHWTRNSVSRRLIRVVYKERSFLIKVVCIFKRKRFMHDVTRRDKTVYTWHDMTRRVKIHWAHLFWTGFFFYKKKWQKLVIWSIIWIQQLKFLFLSKLLWHHEQSGLVCYSPEV